MPIEVQCKILLFDQEEFHSLSRLVLRLAFDVHNDFGRFLDEELCKRELADRCIQAGIRPVQREVRVRLTHEDFRKDYLMDIVLAEGLMIEAKAAECLAPAHHGQSLNYLLLSGMRHGLLVKLTRPHLQSAQSLNPQPTTSST
jgi:GxxExxY protein